MGDTDLRLVTDADAIRQHLMQRLKTFMGEWFLDLRIGVPYLQHVMVKNPSPVVLDSVFKAEIINTPGVTELLAFDLRIDAAARQLQVDFKVRVAGDYGEIISISEVIP